MNDENKAMAAHLNLITAQLSKHVPLSISIIEIKFCAMKLLQNYKDLKNRTTRYIIN